VKLADPPNAPALLNWTEVVGEAGVPLGGAVNVPSALRKFVVPPPDAGTTPWLALVKMSKYLAGAVQKTSCVPPVKLTSEPPLLDPKTVTRVKPVVPLKTPVPTSQLFPVWSAIQYATVCGLAPNAVAKD
jgi:hypothetical protein